MPPAVRLSDKAASPADAHGCPGCPHPTFGPAVNGSTNVFVNKLPAIRKGDPGIHMACCGPNSWNVKGGSSSVYVNGKPIARMGDATKHCGNNGVLITGSPNVFIDDGAAGSMISKLLRALEQAARDGVFGENVEKAAAIADAWRAIRASGGKGGAPKAGKGARDAAGKDKGKARGAKKGQKKHDRHKKHKKHGHKDLSKDAKKVSNKDTGGILKARLMLPAVAPHNTLPFHIETEPACKGTISVEVFTKVHGKVHAASKTSVTAKGTAKVLKGSFKAPLVEGEATYDVFVKASLPGKKPVESHPAIVTSEGLVLYLLEEERGPADPDPEGDVPTGDRGETTVRLTAKHLARKGHVGPVKAVVTIAGREHKVQFNDEGYTVIKPGVPKPAARPAPGKPFKATDMSIRITAPESLVNFYSLRVFAPLAKS